MDAANAFEHGIEDEICAARKQWKKKSNNITIDTYSKANNGTSSNSNQYINKQTIQSVALKLCACGCEIDTGN